MENKFSTHWKSSKQPRKQRKYLANAPLHLRHKFVSINLSKELRKKIGKRNLPAKKGDKVKVCVGKFKGKSGKILSVNLKTSKIIIEEIQVKKMDGSKASVKMQPSNLQIIELTDRKFKEPRSSDKFKKNLEEHKDETKNEKTEIIKKKDVKKDVKNENKENKK